jgi:hypothetical protein
MPVAVFSAVTVAFCTTAPLESVTMPCIAAVVAWQKANGTLTEARKLQRAIRLNAKNGDRIEKERMIGLQNPVKWGTTTFKWHRRSPSLILLARDERNKNFESRSKRLAIQMISAAYSQKQLENITARIFFWWNHTLREVGDTGRLDR